MIEKNIHCCFFVPNCVETVHLYDTTTLSRASTAGGSTLTCRYHYPKTCQDRNLPLPFRLTGQPCRDTFGSLYNWFMVYPDFAWRVAVPLGCPTWKVPWAPPWLRYSLGRHSLRPGRAACPPRAGRRRSSCTEGSEEIWYDKHWCEISIAKMEMTKIVLLGA